MESSFFCTNNLDLAGRGQREAHVFAGLTLYAFQAVKMARCDPCRLQSISQHGP